VRGLRLTRLGCIPDSGKNLFTAGIAECAEKKTGWVGETLFFSIFSVLSVSSVVVSFPASTFFTTAANLLYLGPSDRERESCSATPITPWIVNNQAAVQRVRSVDGVATLFLCLRPASTRTCTAEGAQSGGE
jgi:hypothetical protein